MTCVAAVIGGTFSGGSRMPQRSINPDAELYASPSRWSLELAPGWAAEECVEYSRDERLPYVVVRPGSGDAELRLTTFDPGHIGAAEWVRACAEFNRLKTRPVVPVRFGVFSGCVTEFASTGAFTRRCGRLPRRRHVGSRLGTTRRPVPPRCYLPLPALAGRTRRCGG